MFKLNQEYQREALLDFAGSKQNQSGIIWGDKEPGCVIVTSGGRHGKMVGYGDMLNEDGSWSYIGQGSKGDQDPTTFANSLLVEGNRAILLFSTREPKADEVRARGHHRKLYKFEGIFRTLSWDFYIPTNGKRAGDKLIKFSLIPADNVYDLNSDISGEGERLSIKEPKAPYHLNDLRLKLPNTQESTKAKKGFTAYFAENEEIHPFIKGVAGFHMG